VKRKVLLEPEAQEDLDVTFDFIAKDNPPAAKKYIRELLISANTYAKNPELGRAEFEISARLDEQVRSFLYRNHRLFYVIATDQIRIIRALHTARDIEAILRQHLERIKP